MLSYIQSKPTKPDGQWENTKTTGNLKFYPDDHLSGRDIGMRTSMNFSCQGGYTKNKDGKPLKNVLQMTHAWIEITDGRRDYATGGKQNLQMIEFRNKMVSRKV